jgi:hypothetical protein
MAEQSYSGPALDGTVQHLSEAPYWQDNDGETVDVVDDTAAGKETTENVPVPDGSNPEVPDVDGQSTLEDWEWSA